VNVRLYILFGILGLAGCTTPQPAPQIAHSDAIGSLVTVYVARRKWHIDVGFAAADLDPSLLPLRAGFVSARYLFFGFGDRRYLLKKTKTAPLLLGALWPGPALLLVTTIKDPPDFAFGATQVARLELSAAQAHAIQAFIRASITGSDLTPLAAGPYEGSAYYPASQQYSALHTCNTWAAEALRAGGQRVHSTGVIFASQLWHQVRRLRDQLQGGRVPSWHTTVVEPFAGTTTVVFAGSGGLELLMQPLNMPAASSAPAARTGVIETFIIASVVPASCRPYRFMLSEALSSRQRRTA
jgi:hypothetical protein